MSFHDALVWAIAIAGGILLIWFCIRLYFEEKERHVDRIINKMKEGEDK